MVDCNIFIYIVFFYCFIINVGYEWYVIYFVISYLLNGVKLDYCVINSSFVRRNSV